jgi:hypothetical protein
MGKGNKASKKASEKAIKHAGNVRTFRQKAPKPEGLASYEGLISGYETAYVKTPSGWTFEIQTIDPGMFLGIFGTPFISMLIENKATDEQSVNEIIESMSDEEKVRQANDPTLVNNILEIICRSVINVKLVNKPQSECDRDRQEVSIIMLIETGKLTQDDITQLYKAIFELVRPEEIAKMAESFLRAYNKSENRTNTDTPDSEDLPPDAKSDTIPEDTELPF